MKLATILYLATLCAFMTSAAQPPCPPIPQAFYDNMATNEVDIINKVINLPFLSKYPEVLNKLKNITSLSDMVKEFMEMHKLLDAATLNEVRHSAEMKEIRKQFFAAVNNSGVIWDILKMICSSDVVTFPDNGTITCEGVTMSKANAGLTGWYKTQCQCNDGTKNNFTMKAVFLQIIKCAYP